jgi:hypothetical protein
VLAFVGLASALFITSALHGMNQLARVEFLSQAASDAAGLQIEIDHLLIRVKDAANYVNSGAGNQQLEKVRNPVNGSRYVTDLGYLATQDGQRHSLAGTPTAPRPARAKSPGWPPSPTASPAMPLWPIPTIIRACSVGTVRMRWCWFRDCRAPRPMKS